MDRRAFIKIAAVSGTNAALASCGNPEHQLIRFVSEEEHVPGVAEWKPSLCPLCRAGCGMVVRVMEGETEVVRGGQRGLVSVGLAKKLEGNAAHPISQGRLCARGQAAIQITYHPDRVTQPLKRVGTRGSGEFKPVTWDEALAEILSHLDRLAEAGDQRALVFLTRGRCSQRDELVAQLLERYGAPPAMSFELFGDEVLRRANLLSFGYEQLPTFDLARCRYVLAFGADFLGTWNSPVAQSASYGEMRQGRPGIRGKFVQVEARMSPTGANADEWVPVRPGTEGILALGLAHVILAGRLRPADSAGHAGSLVDGWSAGLRDYSPAEVERRTGVAAARIERLARGLAEQPPAVAIVGGAPLAHTNGLFTALAVNALNALLGSVGQPGGLSFMPQVPLTPERLRPARGAASPSARERGWGPASIKKEGGEGRSEEITPLTLAQMAADILAAPADQSPIQVLLLDEVNPVFTSPPAWRVREALLQIPFIASFGPFIDETSVLADLILPDHSFLESWMDGRPESGAAVAVATLAPPVMRPLHQTRAMPDILLDIGRRLAKPLSPPLPWHTFEEMLQAAFATLPPASASSGDAWTAAQQQGGWWGEAGLKPRPTTGEGPTAREPSRVGAVGRSVRLQADVRPADAGRYERELPGSARVVEPAFDGNPAEYPFHFFPYASQAFLDGSLAHLPWLQELPDVISTAMWSSWVEINPQAAARIQIATGDIVEVASSHGRLRAPALVSPGIAPDVVAMPVGQGHETFTRYATGRGANPINILAPLTEPETGALAWAATRVRVTKVSEPGEPLILFAGAMTERPFGEKR